MPENIFIQNSSLALVLGFIIGLQREMRNYRTESKEFGGGRTFAIIAFLGYLSAFLGGFSPYFLPFSFLVIGSLLVVAKITLANSEKPRGSTTEFSALSAFLIGSMLNFIEPKFVVFSAVVLLLVLNLKDKIQELEKYIGKVDCVVSEGTNVERGREILKNTPIANVFMAPSMEGGAEDIVKRVRELENA